MRTPDLLRAPRCLSTLPLFILLASLSGCTAEPATEESAASEDAVSESPVRLVFASPEPGSCAGCFAARGVIVVKNLAPEKQVDILYSAAGGQWREMPARYVSSKGPDKDVFAFDGLAEAKDSLDVQFAVRYRAAGKEYWDNHSGLDYRVRADNPVVVTFAHRPQLELGHGFEVAVRSAGRCEGGAVDTLCVNAIARRFHREDVRVVWTTDAWTTTKVTDTKLVDWGDGGRFEGRSPYEGNIEPSSAWLGGIGGATRIELAVMRAPLSGNGATDWANADGKNYRCEKGSAGWSCAGGELVPR